MSLPSRLLGANPSIQVSTLLSGSLTTPSAKQSFIPPANFESIATALGTGSSGTITFSSIPATYSHLQLRMISKDTDASDGMLNPTIYFNADTGTNYSRHHIQGTGGNGTLTADGAGTTAGILVISGSLRNSTATNFHSVAIIDIHDYASTTKNTTLRYLAGASTNGSGIGESIASGSGAWFNTAAVSSIRIDAGITWSSTTVLSLYGIRGA